MSLRIFSIFIILSFIGVLSSCQKSETTRTYSEVVTQARETMPTTSDDSDPHAGLDMDSHAAMMGTKTQTDPHAGFTKEQLAQMLQESMGQTPENKSISWTVPEGWQEKSATGMRVATFVEKNDPTAIDCSIVALGAGAGGLTPNIVRWLGQLNISVPNDSELENFINQQEKVMVGENLSALLIDFTKLQESASAATPSMLAAIIETPAQRVFVKMTGSKQKIIEHSSAFRMLIKSLTFRE